MIVGSGLIARAFLPQEAALSQVCLHAAGVSNSACKDASEFQRDRDRLLQMMAASPTAMLFVYFSTCSIDDPSMQKSRYIEHKRELEALVRERGHYLVVRLPQTAGFSPNPHTLLNYLYARISRSERFDLWRFAMRNVIDVEDVARVVLDLVCKENVANETINVANPRSSSMFEIVAALEQVTKRVALYNLIDRGVVYLVDTSRIAASIQRCRTDFDESYLVRTVEKYYGQNACLRS